MSPTTRPPHSARPSPGVGNLTRAPAHNDVPLPSVVSAPQPKYIQPKSSTEVAYSASISPSDLEVYDRKADRYRDWTQDVADERGVQTPETTPGKAAGVGSASWGSLPTLKAENATELSTVGQARPEPKGVSRQRNGPSSKGPNAVVDGISPYLPVGRQEAANLAHRPSVKAPSNIPVEPVTLSKTSSRRAPPPKPLDLGPRIQSTLQAAPAPAPTVPQILVEVPSSAAPVPPPKFDPPIPIHGMDELYPPSRNSSHSSHSVYREREAYIASALELPLDMLNEHLPSARSSSVITTGKLMNLLRSKSTDKKTDEKNRQGAAPVTGSKLKNSISIKPQISKPTTLNRSQTVGDAVPRAVDHLEPSHSTASLPARIVKPKSHQSTKPASKEHTNIDEQGRSPVHPALPAVKTHASESTVKPLSSAPTLRPAPPAPPTTPVTPQHLDTAKSARSKAAYDALFEDKMSHLQVPGLGSSASLRSPEDITPHEHQDALRVPSLGSQRSRRSDMVSRQSQPSAPGSRGDGGSRIEDAQSLQVPTLGSQRSHRSHRSKEDVRHPRPDDTAQAPTLGSATSRRSTKVKPHPPKTKASQPPAAAMSAQPTRSRSTVKRAIDIPLPPSIAMPAEERLRPPGSYLPAGEVHQPIHRQELALPKPALSRPSSMNGTTQALGRRQRDPSSTNLTAHFQPEMYPLPTSTVISGTVPATPQPEAPADFPGQGFLALPPMTCNQDLQSANHELNYAQTPFAPPAANIVYINNSPVIPHMSLQQAPQIGLAPPVIAPQPVRLNQQNTIAPTALETMVAPDQAIGDPPHVVAVRGPVREVQFSPTAENSNRRVGEEEVVVEVAPGSGSKGRPFRMSFAWLREGGSSTSSLPPPLPPKEPGDSLGRQSGRSRRSEAQDLVDLPPTPPREKHRVQFGSLPPMSPSHSPSMPGMRVMPQSPYWPNFPVPHPGYFAPPISPYQMQAPNPFAYPQPRTNWNPWQRSAQSLHPNAASHRPRSPPAPPSVEPPTEAGSPPTHFRPLPQMPYPMPGRNWYGFAHPATQGQAPSVFDGGQGRMGGPSLFSRFFGRSGGGNQQYRDPVSRWRRDVEGRPTGIPPPYRGQPTVAPQRSQPFRPPMSGGYDGRRSGTLAPRPHSPSGSRYPSHEELGRENRLRPPGEPNVARNGYYSGKGKGTPSPSPAPTVVNPQIEPQGGRTTGFGSGIKSMWRPPKTTKNVPNGQLVRNMSRDRDPTARETRLREKEERRAARRERREAREKRRADEARRPLIPPPMPQVPVNYPAPRGPIRSQSKRNVINPNSLGMSGKERAGDRGMVQDWVTKARKIVSKPSGRTNPTKRR